MAALQAALSAVAADHYRRGEHVALVVDTRQQAADLNAAIRERLAAIGRVDDTRTVTTRAVHRIGAGDRLATRRNDRDLGVANRDTWTVTAVGRHGELVVTPAGATGSDVTPAGVTPPDGVPAGVTPQLEGRRVLPADYAAWHVEQAYASTAHGVQGDTVTTAHTVIGEQTGAASAYGMTRGRTANTAHLVSTDLREARKQWIAVFGRDRADLDPAHAAGLAAAEAPATPRPAPPRPAHLMMSLPSCTQLGRPGRAAWTDSNASTCSARCSGRPSPGRQKKYNGLAALEDSCRQTASDAADVQQRAHNIGALVAADSDRIRDTLLRRWDAERETVRDAARVVLDGRGRFGLRRSAVAHAREQLAAWSTTWAPHLPDLPTDPGRIAETAAAVDDPPALWAAIHPRRSPSCRSGPPRPPRTGRGRRHRPAGLRRGAPRVGRGPLVAQRPYGSPAEGPTLPSS